MAAAFFRNAFTCSLVVSTTVIGGCNTSEQHAESPAGTPAKQEAATLTCPSLSATGTADLAALFGIDATLAAKLERTIRLAGELEEATQTFLEKTNAVCSTLATDLDPTPVGNIDSPCVVAANRLSNLRSKIRVSGAKLAIRIDNVRCSIPEKEIAACAGECLTGVPGVISKVECSGKARNASPALASPAEVGECSGEIGLPNAPGSCLTQCRARTLRLVKCDADVAVTAEGAAIDPALSATLEKLKRDVPSVIALGADGVARIAKLSSEVGPLVDDVAGAIDAMTSSGSAKERRVAVGAVLATCFAPPLARTVQASKKLAGSLEGAKALHANLTAP